MASVPNRPEAFATNMGGDIDLREYIEALFREKERALDMAAAERDRAAEVLRDEQRRALLVAETEREKAAAALRQGTDRAIADNFSRLNEKLDASKTLAEEQEKHRREIEIERSRAVDAAFAAAEKAVEKAEVAQARVNATQNEFRGALNDQNRLTESTMLPRREFEAQYHEAIRQIEELRNGFAQLRTDVAVGPTGLKQLQSGADRSAGEKTSNQNTTRLMLALVTIGAMLFVGMLGTIVTLIING